MLFSIVHGIYQKVIHQHPATAWIDCLVWLEQSLIVGKALASLVAPGFARHRRSNQCEHRGRNWWGRMGRSKPRSQQCRRKPLR